MDVARFIRREKSGVLATVSRAGAPEAAFVSIAAVDDGTLIVDSSVSFRKIENLRSDSRVALVVGSGSISVQIEGLASLAVEDNERQRLGSEYVAQFPGSRALVDGFAVIGIRPRWVRVYDASVSSPVVTEAHWPPDWDSTAPRPSQICLDVEE